MPKKRQIDLGHSSITLSFLSTSKYVAHLKIETDIKTDAVVSASPDQIKVIYEKLVELGAYEPND